MREVVLMWRHKRMVGLTIAIAVIYAVVLLPFKQLALLPGFSTIRPANVLPVVFGLMFGPAAAWGSLLGNLIGDLLGGTWSAGSYFGAIGNFFTAFVVYRLWGNLGVLSTGREPDLSTGDQFPEYVVVSFTAGCITAAIIGWGHEIVSLVPFPIIGLTIVFNNTIAELFLGPPLLYLLYRRAQNRGLLYHQLLDDQSLPSSNAFQRPAAIALVVLSIGWIVTGSLYGIVVENISLHDIIAFHDMQAAGSTVQVMGGTILFALVIGVSVFAGERMSKYRTANTGLGRTRDSSLTEVEGGERILRHSNIGILAIVGLSVTLAVLYAIALTVRVSSDPVALHTAFLQFGIGLVLPAVLIGGAWWLSRTTYTHERIWRITLWVFGGIGIVTVLSAWQFYHILLGLPSAGAVIEGFLLNIQAGAVGGLVIGMYDARAELTSEELAAERDKLRRENERLEEFAHVVSHDLRNPLDVATGRLALAREDTDNEHLESVAKAHDRMGMLIDDLLTLAREGQTVSELETVNLPETFQTCWATVETGEATIEIETNQVIRADRNRVRQLIENVFRNAIEHGGETVTITVGDLADGFYIEDDGDGIPEEKREQVFKTGYSTGEGTGFGLSIVDQIADAHGGEVTITDGSTGGARFEFRNVDLITE